MPVGVDGQAQFGADAVGSRDQHRAFPASRGQLHQGAKATHAGQYLGPMGALYQRLDAFDQFVSGVDIDARIAIG